MYCLCLRAVLHQPVWANCGQLDSGNGCRSGGRGVVGAQVTLTNTGTGAVRHGNHGQHRNVPVRQNLQPGTYSVTIRAPGSRLQRGTAWWWPSRKPITQVGWFFRLAICGIDIRHGGSGAGTVGEFREVPDRGRRRLEDLTLKGRDLFGYLRLVPGVIDTAASRDVTSHGAISGMSINGATASHGELYRRRDHRHGYRIERLHFRLSRTSTRFRS